MYPNPFKSVRAAWMFAAAIAVGAVWAMFEVWWNLIDPVRTVARVDEVWTQAVNGEQRPVFSRDEPVVIMIRGELVRNCPRPPHYDRWLICDGARNRLEDGFGFSRPGHGLTAITIHEYPLACAVATDMHFTSFGRARCNPRADSRWQGAQVRWMIDDE